MTKTISAVAIFIAFTGIAGASIFGDNYMGVSKKSTQIENQVATKCSKYDTNFAKFQSCKKRVTKEVTKRFKKSKGGKK